MSPRHHPGEDTLIAYAAGTLGAGPSLVVAVHLDGCRQCGVLVASLEAAGGVLMAQLPPADMSPQALARAMAAIERPLPMVDLPPNGRTAGRSLAFSEGFALPATLQHRRLGRWRWLAPGMRWSRVDVPGDRHAKVVLLRGRGEALLPAHGHSGGEFTQVLAGAIMDGATRFGSGDMLVADDATNHHLRVAAGAECVCLTAIEGRMRMNGIIGQLLQPLVGP